MYQISDEYKGLVLADGTKHILKIYIEGQEVNPNHILDFKVSHSLFLNDEFCLGSVTAKMIEFRIYKDSLPNIYNRFYVESGVGDEIVPIGFFILDSIGKEDDDTITIKAIDSMVKFEFNYDGSSLTFPATMLQVLNDICLKAGVECGSTSFLNCDKSVAVYDNTVSAREFLSYIAEQAGGFACVGRDGKLYIRRIGECVIDFDLKYFQDFTWGEKFKVSRVAYEDGVQDFKFGDDTDNTIWMNQDNMYVVCSEQIQNIYNEYVDFECYCFEGTTIVDPAYDVGDVLIIDGKRVIYQGEMDYVGKFKADISSKIQAKTKEETTVTKPSTNRKIRRVQSSIDQVKGEIESLVQEVDESSEKMSQVLQTVDEITQKVENVADLTKIMNGVKTIVLEEAVAGPLIELRILGNNVVFDCLTLSDGLCVSEETILQGDSDVAVNDVVYDLGIDEVLRQCEGVCDEYVYRYKDNTAKVIRRVGVNESGDLYVLDEEMIEDLPVPAFELKEGTNIITILSYGANLSATYVVKNDYTDIFATRSEMRSSVSQSAEEIRLEVDKKVTDAKGELLEDMSTISQKADEIDLEVRKKVGKNEIISRINQSAEAVTIEAGRVNLTGLVRVSDLSGEGSTTIDGANIKTGTIGSDRLDTTTIHATNGTIGGFSITDNSLHSNSAGFTSNELVAFWAGTSAGDVYAGHHPFEATWNGAVYALNGVYTWMSNHHVPVISTLADHFDGVGVEVERIFRNQDTYTFTFAVANSGTWSIQMSPPSDKKLKDNIEETDVQALDVVNRIQFRQFDWNDAYKKLGFVNFERHVDFGVVADELEEIDERFVTENRQEDGSIIKTVNREELIYYNAKAIQELCEENERLRCGLEDLRARVEFLECEVVKK